MLRAFSIGLTRHAILVLVGLTALTGLALAQIVDFRTGALRLQIDTSFEQMLPSGDANRAFYDRVRRVFGNDETLLLVLHRPGGVFEPELLASIARLTPRVEAVTGVASVLSLSNAPNIASEAGDILIAPLFDTPPTHPAELAEVRRKAFANPLYAGNLVNASGDTTSLVIQLLDVSEAEFTQLSGADMGWVARLLGIEPPRDHRAIDRQIQALAAEEFGAGVETWLVGSAHIKAETTRTLISDLVLVIPLALVLIAAVAGASFRTVRGVLLPLLAIGISVIWTLGVMATIDPLLNLVTVSVPMLLLVIGFAYAVHVLSCYYHAVDEGPDPKASPAARGLEAVLLPTLVTSLTTVAGFFSLVTHPLAAIRQFGLYGGVGVGFAGIAAITFVPAALQLLREQGTGGAAPATEGGHHGAPTKPFDRLLVWLGEFDVKNARTIFAIVALLALLSAIGIPRIDVNSTMVSNFPEGSTVRTAVQAVNEHLGGAGQINVVLETDYPKGFTEPSILKQVEDLQAWLVDQPAVSGTTSILDYIKLLHQAFNDNDPAKFSIPASRNLVTQLLFFGGSDDTKRFVDSQYQLANILVRTTALDSGDLGVLVRAVEERVAQLQPPVSGRVTGNLVLISKTNDEIAIGQAISVTSAFAMIFAIMALLFMSLRIGFVAMVPNVFPVLLYFGVLGWTGVTLNVTTGLVASIVLGIAVDDTIHFFSNFNRFAREKASETEGVKATLLHLGRPVTYASLSLCAGFAILSLSQLQQQAEFGLLAAGTLLAAAVADLTFNPALTSRVKVVTLWDALTLDLGENPHQVIPLFHGFSKWQARIVALMTEIVETQAGERLMQTGAKANGMYLVIEGELASSIERDGQRVPLNRHGRGDVLGEVGLFRGERTANVDCTSPCRLLRFDQKNLAQLQRRYPRTAAKLMRNLSEVLADRLKAATQRVRG